MSDTVNPAKQVGDNFAAAIGLPPEPPKDTERKKFEIVTVDDAELDKRADEMKDVGSAVSKRLRKIAASTEDDLRQSRSLTNQLLDITAEAINDLADLAKGSENPRAYEVLFASIKVAADLTESKTKQADASVKLLERMRKVDVPAKGDPDDDQPGDPKKITLTTHQLQEMLLMAAEKRKAGQARKLVGGDE